MLGLGSESFDPETLVILETAFDEAWITLKLTAVVTSGLTSSRDAARASSRRDGRKSPDYNDRAANLAFVEPEREYGPAPFGRHSACTSW
jgi:hypothetical protein